MRPGAIVNLGRICEGILQRDELLDRSGKPLLYSPAFCGCDRDLMSGGWVICGGQTQRRKSDGVFF